MCTAHISAAAQNEQQDCVIVEGINMKLFYIQQYDLSLISSNIVKKHSTPDGAAAYSTINKNTQISNFHIYEF